MITRVDKQLGEILLEKGVINSEQLEQALHEQKERGPGKKKIGNYLKELGYVSEEEICQALGIQFNLAVMSLEDIRIKPDVLDLVPENLARKFNILPLFVIGKELTLAISDPTGIQIFDIVRAQSGCRVVPVIAPYSEITKFINKHYLQKIETSLKETAEETETKEISRTEIDELKKAGADLPIVKTVDRLLIEAVENEASDIHLEPREKSLSVRFRIDGVLHEMANYPLKMSPGIISRTKILSSLDISERQKPQDGRIQVKIDKKEIDIRVSTLPTQYGEKVVMRLLNRSSVKVEIKELGFSEKNLTCFEQLLSEPYGIILVTGPTGSGKTTTLYAALNKINSIEKNIMTVEDPVEYQIPLINQVQINLKKDLTFANTLRSFLRQDPDIIMVGEIRDPETAAIAAESALTGHLVLSTLHTNDAPSSITRLIDMGVEPFLISPSLLGIVSQRLVRKICPKCKEEYHPSEAEMESVGLYVTSDDLMFYRSKGCKKCKKTGYKGRTGIHEVLIVDEKIRELISKKASVDTIRQEASKDSYKDMRFDGLRKVLQGITTVEELLRVTRNT
jgi:type IV pilus assembly protein PilB